MVLNKGLIVSFSPDEDNVKKSLVQHWSASMSYSQPSLPANRAFVVQFRAQPIDASSTYEGRVEHLLSGQVGRFHSLEELLAFMVRVLSDVQAQTDAG
jgi:hypothetical protein